MVDLVERDTKNDIELTCAADNLPEFIEIDCENIELNSAIMQFSLILPEGVELSQNLLNGQDQPVVACSATRATFLSRSEGCFQSSFSVNYFYNSSLT